MRFAMILGQMYFSSEPIFTQMGIDTEGSGREAGISDFKKRPTEPLIDIKRLYPQLLISFEHRVAERDRVVNQSQTLRSP